MILTLEQSGILEKLANLLYNSCTAKYDFISLECNYMPNYNTFGVTLSIRLLGQENYIIPPDGMASDSIDLAEELHTLMKAHTGGEWSSLTLTLDTEGKAHTKFYYPDSPLAE